MAMKQFKTESKRLLDLMANSIYTNTDIFVRELISNASDALDKKYYLSLTDTSIKAEDLKIKIDIKPEERLFIISDNGLGMNDKDLENNLGTIAKSGSYQFKLENEGNNAQDIIGQFGVGFYSAFMVADRIEVVSRKVKEDKAYSWVSKNADGYEIKEATRENEGTTITLHIKDSNEEKNYDNYLNSDYIVMLIKKYSDFISYPIEMNIDVIKQTKEEGKTETVKELQTINSMTPLWKKDVKDIKEEEYNDFYETNWHDYNKPLKTIHYKVEGTTSYTAMLFIPEKAPYDYYTTEYKVGLKLYSKGVFIKDEAKELVSDYFRFVRGIVDSDDLSLNISREILQEDYQMRNLKKSLDKKIKNALEKMLKDDREQYEQFFSSFGAQLKYGAYEDYGANRDLLLDLILFKSSYEDKYVTLKEYVSRMKDNQNEIFYACGENIDKIKAMPQMESLLEQGYEVLYFTENVDEFMASVLMNYDGKNFKSIAKADLGIESEEEKQELKDESEENKDLLTALKDELKDEVKDVRLSSRLKSHPVCLVSDDGISLDMEKVLKELNQGEMVKANRILEINKDHPLFKALKNAYDKGENLNDYAKLLYDQALLIAGLTIEDPIAYSKHLSNIMIKSLDK